jgi:hypothetical protein
MSYIGEWIRSQSSGFYLDIRALELYEIQFIFSAAAIQTLKAS